MHISSRYLLFFQGIASAALLGFALFSQYGFGLHPCHLCLLQRYPYAAVIAISLIGLAWGRPRVSLLSAFSFRHPGGCRGPGGRQPDASMQRDSKCNIVTFLLIINILLFLTDFGIAAYHAGVEAHIFSGPTDCTATGSGDSLEELRAAILNAPLVTCDQAMVHFLGLSMAAWNALAALALGLASAIFLLKCRKKDRS